MATVQELRTLAKARKIPKYSRMTKPQLLGALGMSDEKRSTKSQTTKRKAIDAHSTAIADGNATKRAQIKGRLTRAIKRELDAAKKSGKELTQDEKRAIAAKALASEVKAIKAGKPENTKRGKTAKSSEPAAKPRKSSSDLSIADLDKSEAMLKKSFGKAKGISGKKLDIEWERVNLQNRNKDIHIEELGDAAKPQVTHGKADFKRKPKPESVEPKLKLEDVKTPEDRAKYAKQEAEHQRSQGNHKAAEAWEDEAKKARKAALDRDVKAQKNTQTSLFGVTDHASDMPLFGGSQHSEPKKPERPANPPRGVVEISPHDLHFDPKRFQYKIVAEHNQTGSSGSLSGVRKWDENLGGVMQVWRDPKDGKDYVVNGHNRTAKAQELGAEKVAVRYLHVDTPHEARAIGALTNIAEGRGNALDAAKFLRDSGITREDLEAKGIPMREKIATDGLALSKLAPHLFDKVVQGDIPIERATLIGDRIHDHDAQSKLVELIDKEQKKGRKINNDVVRELADTVQHAPTHSEMQFSLFGAEETTRNLALEKAELTAEVRKRLSREKKLFGVVSKSKAAKDLERGGNQIDTDKSREISEQAGQVLGVFDHLKHQSGPVSHAINRAVERIANGEPKKQVTDDLHKQLLEDIPQALGLGKRSSADGTKEASGSATTAKKLRVRAS